MIKIDKDLTKIPASLQVPPVKRVAKTTQRVREEVVLAKKYPSENAGRADSRYKYKDIKKAIFDLYRGKCAFCEQRIEIGHVEHFRPKNIYYWLAFSWDNLLWACSGCNTHKSNIFDLDGQRITTPPAGFADINTISATYDATEKPKFIHPEREDAEPLLAFQKDGLVKSDDPRAQYTIDTCHIHRKRLNDRRKELWDGFVNDLKSEIAEGKTKQEIRADIMVLVRKFRRDAEQNPDNEFLAFRRYALHHFLSDTLNEILGS